MGSPQLHRLWSGSTRGSRPDPSANPFAQRRQQVSNSNTLLLHRIAVPQRDRVAQSRVFFSERLEIDGHAERGTDFVLAPISATDGATLVVKHSHVRAQESDNLPRFGD